MTIVPMRVGVTDAVGPFKLGTVDDFLKVLGPAAGTVHVGTR